MFSTVSAVELMWNMDITKGNLVYNGAQNDTSGLVGEATSEDCLHLAIWTPTNTPKDGKGLPVLFFMTGGGWVIGGVDLPWQIPTSWVERSQEHIVVSINYRLNIFGFPNARGLDQQNLGILDQRAALEWVRDNIAAFGGDPERIMHWGRSAGATATDLHSYAYADDPIAESYYMESGHALLMGASNANFSWVAENVGCDDPCAGACDDEEQLVEAELDCMRQVSFLQITNFMGGAMDRGEIPSNYFMPVRDDVVVFKDYPARAAAGKVAKRPSMLSFTSHEVTSLFPWPENVTEGPYMPPLIDASIQFAVCPSINFTRYRNELEDAPPVFRFQYAAEFPNLNVYDWLGAYHNAETPLIFGTYHILDHVAKSTAFQDEVSHAMQDHILAFAKDPYKGPQKLGWEPVVVDSKNGGALLRFGGSNGEAVEHVDGHEVDGVCLGIGEYDAYPYNHNI